MAQATFAGRDNTPLAAPPAENTQKPADAALDRAEAQRLADGKPQQPGANKRAGVASRDPEEFDSHARARRAHGDAKPVQDPVL